MALFDFIRSRGFLPPVKNAPPPMPETRPARGLRALGRAVRSAYAFQAADTGRLNGNWTALAIPADWIITRNLRPLVARSREQCMNNDYAKAFLRLCRQNVVGPNGVVLKTAVRKPRGGMDEETNRALKDAWEDWGHKKNASVTGKRSWKAIQRQCVQSAAQDGEFFVRIVMGADAGPWGFALQVIDPLRIPIDYNVDKYNAKNFIRHGIEFTQYGRPVAYHLTTVDDGEAEYQYGGVGYIRIPADEMIHGYLEDLVGQKRGLPWMATALFRMRHMQGFEDAAIINARVGASKMGFVQWAEGRGPDWDDEESESALQIDAEPGTFPVLPDGAELKEFLPQYPTGEFLPTYKTLLRGATAGMGVAYNNLANDLEGVNFSSIRQGTLDEREHWKELQEWLIEDLIQPVFEAWLKYSLLKGRIVSANGTPLSAALYSKLQKGCGWQPRRWQWIDPTADVDAAVNSKNALLKSPGEIIREWGGDPVEVWAEFAADIAAMKGAGIPEDFIMATLGQQLANPTASEGAKPNS
ncbi:phage portal protein [Paraburkholderia sp. J12]|uniref:phage portal protein n=1 Tax=Paraburkholderia sp. J12 TaxID=2805432 RepID=UPI002ABE74CD|nr:phage portal protein [Paraburkholderia sp. J12]